MTLLTWLKCTTDSPSLQVGISTNSMSAGSGKDQQDCAPCSMSDAFAWETAACSSNEWLEGSGAIDSCPLCITAKTVVMRGAPRRGPCALFDSLHPPERGEAAEMLRHSKRLASKALAEAAVAKQRRTIAAAVATQLREAPADEPALQSQRTVRTPSGQRQLVHHHRVKVHTRMKTAAATGEKRKKTAIARHRQRQRQRLRQQIRLTNRRVTRLVHDMHQKVTG